MANRFRARGKLEEVDLVCIGELKIVTQAVAQVDTGRNVMVVVVGECRQGLAIGIMDVEEHLGAVTGRRSGLEMTEHERCCRSVSISIDKRSSGGEKVSLGVEMCVVVERCVMCRRFYDGMMDR